MSLGSYDVGSRTLGPQTLGLNYDMDVRVFAYLDGVPSYDMLLLALNEAAALRSSRTEAVLLTSAMQDPSSLAPQSQKKEPCLEYVTSCPA